MSSPAETSARRLAPEVLETAPGAEAAAAAFRQRLPEVRLPAAWEQEALRLRLVAENRDGYALRLDGAGATLAAGSAGEFLAGVGRLLEEVRAAREIGAGLAPAELAETPRHPVRCHYMPGHFGNSFEVMWEREMGRYLEDLALWGSSGYADWFDPNDMPDPYAPEVYCSTSMALWERKKAFLRRARELGLATAICLTHNVGYVDQLRPEWAGVRSHEHRVQGQVLCPSTPAARRVCLQNHENLLRDLAESGVELDRIFYITYDDGGCACAACQPYYPTFLSMVEEIHSLARRIFPEVRASLCGWWLSPEDFARVRAFAAGPARDWLASFQFAATYGVREVPDLSAELGGVPLTAFFHLGFSGARRDVYIRTGLHSAPERIASVVRSFAGAGCRGFYGYNESVGDHLNQFLATRLARDPERQPADLLGRYVRQVLDLSGPAAERVAGVLAKVESLDESRAAEWLGILDGVAAAVQTPPRQGWAWRHLHLKARLLALDHRIGSGEEWQRPEDLAPVRALIEERLALSEVLWRDVYGMGVPRHILIRDRSLPPWYHQLRRVEPLPRGRIRPGSHMQQDA
jgi:hypothetical protein